MLLLPSPFPCLPHGRSCFSFSPHCLYLFICLPLFPILSVSSTREGRIADVFTIVVSLDRKVRRGYRYRACSLPISFLRARPSPPTSRFFPSILSRSFLIVARRENPKPRSNSSDFRYLSRLLLQPRAYASAIRYG